MAVGEVGRESSLHFPREPKKIDEVADVVKTIFVHQSETTGRRGQHKSKQAAVFPSPVTRFCLRRAYSASTGTCSYRIPVVPLVGSINLSTR